MRSPSCWADIFEGAGNCPFYQYRQHRSGDMKIETVKITVNGKQKIVNADDPRAQAKPKPAPKPKPKPKSMKGSDK
jgi:hypothetical protein